MLVRRDFFDSVKQVIELTNRCGNERKTMKK